MGKYSKYKGIQKELNPQMIKGLDGKIWRANCTINNISWTGPYRLTDREAAIDYDKRLIKFGKSPVNILKKKL